MAIDVIDLAIGVGVSPPATVASKSLLWSETHLIRWVGQRMTPIGGIEKLSVGSTFASTLRAIHRWITLSGTSVTAYICDNHAYADTGSGPFDITPTGGMTAPPASYTAGGYGDGAYSDGTYGTARPDRPAWDVIPPVWSVDNWGEDLVFMSSIDGRLLKWSPSTPATKATAVANAPMGRSFVVSPFRYVVIFGAGGVFNRIRWCHEENITVWDLNNVNYKSGDLYVMPFASIVSVCKSGSDILLFTSDNSAFVMSFIGVPFIFGMSKFNAESVPLSPESVVETPVGCVWASNDGFWMYSGGSAVPLVSPVWQWVDDVANKVSMRFVSTFVILNSFSEVYFFFPSSDTLVNDRYVVWNYRENWWANGYMGRSCGIKQMYTGTSLMALGNDVYRHESGNAYDGVVDSMPPWAKSFNFNPYSRNLASVGKFFPDTGQDDFGLSFELLYNIKRSGKNVEMSSGELLMLEDGYVPFRETGKDFRLVVRQKVNSLQEWTMGASYIEAIRRGVA